MNYNIRKFFSNCFKHKTPNNHTERLTLIDANATEFEKLEINAIKQFVLNIYISVCYAMERSSKIINLGNIDESTCLETNEYRINKTKILQNKTSKLSSDIIVEQCDNFFIDIIEYAPKIFTYLRQIDKLNEDVIITSFLPMKNKQGIQESEGRSGNFFINTDDKRFILKTLLTTVAQLRLMQSSRSKVLTFILVATAPRYPAGSPTSNLLTQFTMQVSLT
jgi:hypothetical protein